MGADPTSGSRICLLSSQTEGGDLKRTLFREQLARLYIPLSCHTMRTAAAAASLKFRSHLPKLTSSKALGWKLARKSGIMRDWLKCASIASMPRSRLLLDCAETKGRTREAKITQGRMLKTVRRLEGRFNLGSRMKVEMKISLKISKPSARDIRRHQQSINKV